MILASDSLHNCSIANYTQNCTIIVNNGTNSTKTTLTVLTSPGFLKIEQIILMCFAFICVGIMYSCSNTIRAYSFRKSIQLHSPASKILDPTEIRKDILQCVNLETTRSAKITELAKTLCTTLKYSHLGFIVDHLSNHPCIPMKQNIIQNAYSNVSPRSTESLRDAIRAEKRVSDVATAQQLQLFLDIYESQKYGPSECSHQQHETFMALCSIFRLPNDQNIIVQKI